MTLEQLKILVRVVQAGSFTRAAEALDTPKSHVSRVIAQLEAELGVKLLERTTRTLSITETGREVYERAVGILGAVDDTVRVAQQAQGEPRGVLRLTCSADFGTLAVGRWIEEYLVRHPGAAVEADYTSRVLDLVHEGIDLSIRVGALEESRLVARRLGEMEYGLFASADYLREHGVPAEPADLRRHALIMFSAGTQRRGWKLVPEGASVQGEVVRIEGPARLRVNDSFAVRDAVARGLGIAQLPLLVVGHPHGGHGPRSEDRTEGLVRVLPQWAREPVPVHAVYPSHRYLSPKVRAFIDLAAELLERAHAAARQALARGAPAPKAPPAAPRRRRGA